MEVLSKLNPLHKAIPSEPLMRLKSVSKQFGGFKAVKNLDLAVRAGELHCLIGPNGAGKSTVFKLLTGIYSVTRGKIFLKEKDITQWPIWKRSRYGLSIKMQVSSVYGELSVRDNMQIAAQHHIRPEHQREEIVHLLSQVRLDEMGATLAKDLSHGQQQWLELGMAFSTRPSLLLLDEPVAGMGPDESRETGEIIQALHSEGMTVLVVEHDMTFVGQIAQKVTVLHNGEFFAEGSLEEIEKREDVIQIYLGKD